MKGIQSALADYKIDGKFENEIQKYMNSGTSMNSHLCTTAFSLLPVTASFQYLQCAVLLCA